MRWVGWQTNLAHFPKSNAPPFNSMSPKRSPRQQICLVCTCSCAKRQRHDFPIAPGEVMTLAFFYISAPPSKFWLHAGQQLSTHVQMITSKSLLLATEPYNSKILCEEEASDPPWPNERPWNPGKNKISPPLPPFKVNDDGNNSNGRDSNGDSDGDGDDVAAVTDGNVVDDNNSGILSTAIGGERGRGSMQHDATTNQTRGAQWEAKAWWEGEGKPRSQKMWCNATTNKWRGVKRGGGADWEAEGGHRATRQLTEQVGRNSATKGGGAGWGIQQSGEDSRQEAAVQQQWRNNNNDDTMSELPTIWSRLTQQSALCWEGREERRYLIAVIVVGSSNGCAQRAPLVEGKGELRWCTLPSWQWRCFWQCSMAMATTTAIQGR